MKQSETLFDKMKEKRIFCIILILLFSLISYIFIAPESQKTRSIYRSTELRRMTRKEGKKEIISYVDDEGMITVAADLGKNKPWQIRTLF